MTRKVILSITAVVLVVVAVVGYFATRTPGTTFGAAGGLLAENYLPFILYNGGFNTAKSIKTTGDLTVGTNGTTVSQLQKGTCVLIASSFTVAASTTVPMDCAITGVVSTDTVFGMFATSSAVSGGWEIVTASASSTAGFVTFGVYNGIGVSTVIPASIASSTTYLIIR